ncbi:MAG: hypothetical protein ABII18_05980 [bacterium]|nr:hypothetical protein [bacterium]MBU1916792.1 hypothetical protein [bacterium]
MLIVNQLKNIENLKSFSYFDLNTLSQIVEISKNSLYSNINRWLKQDIIIQLKKGLYVTKSFFDLEFDKDNYLAFIANKLREPSYLSTEYVLQNYNILTEAVYGITSITLKTPRNYSNKLGYYIYRNVKTDLFYGYNIVQKGKYKIKIATKAKALFDYLYLKTYRTPVINNELIESFRLNLDEFSNKDFKEFSIYCQRTNIKKYLNLTNILKDTL